MVIFLRPARRSKAIFISAFVFLCLIYTLFSGFSGFAGLSAAGRPYDTWVADGFSRATSNTSDAINCNAFSLPGASEVQVVLKTGAAEAFDKLLVHLSTVTSCINPSDILIFSDLEEDVGQWHLYDALSRLPTSYRSSNADFAVYEAQQTYRQAKVSLKSLQGGWALDKYKFLPMMDMAFQLRPEKKWFLFIEADTFVVWDNFFYWISHLNPDEPLYLGSPVWPKGKTVFAHGGSGLVLSHAALRVLTKDAVGTSTSKPGSHQHGVDMTKQCCGDEVLAQVLKNKGISIHGYWPMFNGEKPSTVKFGKEHWCEPVITLHHLSPEDTSEFWRWLPTRAAGTAGPLLFQDMFQFIVEHLGPLRENWDNLSEDIEVDNVKRINITSNPLPHTLPVQDCRTACKQDPDCFQFRWSEGSCLLSHSIRLGHPTLPKMGNKPEFISGWDMEKIHQWTHDHSPCLEPHWVRANP